MGDATFGCGQFLPGDGPGGFSDNDFGGGGDVPNGGGGNNWDRFDGDVDDSDPGPPVNEDWQCRVVGEPEESDYACTQPTQEDCHLWIYKQQCIDISLGDPGNPGYPPDTSDYDRSTDPPNPGGGCIGAGGTCPDLEIRAWNNTSTPPPGGGGGGGVGPDPGPTTPGPGTPGAPGGTLTECTCRVTGKNLGSPCTPGPGQDGCQSFSQECVTHFKGAPPSNDSSFTNLISKISGDPKIESWGYSTTTPNETCRTIEDICAESCPSVTVWWKYKIEGGDPPQQFDGGGNGGIFTGGDKTGGKHGGGVIIDDDGGGGGPDTVPPGGGGQIPKWYCTNTGGVKGCVYNAFYGPKTATYKTRALCLVHCRNEDEGGDYFSGGVTGDRDDTGAGGIDGGGGFFSGGTTGARDDTGAGGMQGSNQSPPPLTDLGRVVFNSNFIDLNSPAMKYYAKKTPSTRVMNPEIAITAALPTKEFVKNPNRLDPIFGKKIHKSIEYILDRNNSFRDWDSNKVYNITSSNLMDSLNPEFVSNLQKITNIDGTKMSKSEIYSLVSSKLLDGTISDLDSSQYISLKDKTKRNETLVIKPSTNPEVNEVAALSLLDQNLVPLDPTVHTEYDSQILKNWKVLSTDVSKYIEVKVGSELKKYYIGDNDSLLSRTTLAIQDGEYITVTKDGKKTRLYCKSEKDHAFIVPEKIRQAAIKLLGGTGNRTLSVSSDTSAPIEFNYSLSSPRQNVYVMKLVLSSINTNYSLAGSNLLKSTAVQYELMDSSSIQGVRDINKYIQYKANYRPYFISQDDLIFDYIESTSSLSISQEDILFDAPKTNKLQPLLLRQIPPTIFIIPTNRTQYEPNGSKSKISSLNSNGDTVRELTTSPSPDPDISDPKNNQFISYSTPYFDGVLDVYGELNTQTRTSVFDPDSTIYTTACVSAGVVGAAEDFPFVRKKTTYRLIKEIIEELNSNYVLDREGLGLGITTFDVISRLGMTEFNKFTALENSKLIFPLIRDGLFNGVRVFPPVKDTGLHRNLNTRIVQRRATASADKFLPIKSMTDGFFIDPPTSTPYSSTFTSEKTSNHNEAITEGRE